MCLYKMKWCKHFVVSCTLVAIALVRVASFRTFSNICTHYNASCNLKKWYLVAILFISRSVLCEIRWCIWCHRQIEAGRSNTSERYFRVQTMWTDSEYFRPMAVLTSPVLPSWNLDCKHDSEYLWLSIFLSFIMFVFNYFMFINRTKFLVQIFE